MIIRDVEHACQVIYWERKALDNSPAHRERAEHAYFSWIHDTLDDNAFINAVQNITEEMGLTDVNLH